jgi:uncharacterized protein (DUF1499 family)
MAKQYTQAEWARIQSRLPEEDRVPYADSPEKFLTSADYVQRTADFASRIEPGVTPDMFPSSVTGVEPAASIPPIVVGGTVPTATNVGTTPIGTQPIGTQPAGPTKYVVNTFTDPNTGDVIAVWSDGSQTVLAKGGKQGKASESAWNLLKGFFDTYGLGVLADDVKKYIGDNLSYDEMLLKLRTESKAYKARFGANDQRIAKGLRALSEAEYIAMEDKYQDIMRRYGMPESYYAETMDPTGVKVQKGFEKFIAGDVSAVELEDRIQTAYNRVIKAAPEVSQALKQFYPDITNGDILAYALDPSQAIENIKRKVTAAEIGGAAMGQGLATGVSRAEELAAFGVTREQARQGFQNVATVLPRASTLSDIYAEQGLGEYTQATAEQEFLGLSGSAEAERKRRQLAQLEQASFSGSSGMAQGALARDRAGAI